MQPRRDGERSAHREARVFACQSDTSEVAGRAEREAEQVQKRDDLRGGIVKPL